MSTLAPTSPSARAGQAGPRSGARLAGLVFHSPWLSRGLYTAVGLAVLLAFWWLGGYLLAADPATAPFAGFAPGPTFAALWDLVWSASLYEAIWASFYRLGLGLLWAAAIGVPLGVAVGYFRTLREITHVPFQFLRMISPLSWMPIAVLVFATWNQAIVFLIAVAAVWPITFSTAHGVQRIDPLWLKVARNMGAEHLQMLRRIILPAIAQDIFSGIRMAVGVAWIVLVPAEFLGVTSGLGYAINDARDTLSYATLSAIVVVIGTMGFLLDGLCLLLIRRFSWRHEA
ncbi:ABC transporter permease [Thiohalorhabdus methylotrophus]|uniref:ABC transporter permease n=1 Tax=Thiohalorhabdus methylotrophus TaxID=3242694 RepID=A0ABV4TW97_9GAMM